MTKVRCVADTNVLISSLLLKNSTPFQVVEQIFLKGVMLRSESTLAEVRRVLGKKKLERYITTEERQIFLAKFLLESELVEIRGRVEACRDPKDNQFLELAVNGQADFIVTGDEDLLVLHPFRAIPILTPRDFLHVLEEVE
ncbi:MAG: putative toxin-antitoxin system toxin component, PIN family [Leptolyngbyaceae cyanobacterium]